MRIGCGRRDCEGVRFTDRACHICEMEVSIAGLLNRAMDAFLRDDAKTPPWMQRRSRRYYFLFSLLLLYWTQSLMEPAAPSTWIPLALLSIVYIGASLTVALIVYPQFLKRLAPSGWHVKLSFILNYFSALFALQWVLATWWERSLRIAGLIITTWAGVFFFLTFLFPGCLAMAAIFLRKESGPSLETQGRNIRHDL